MSVQTLFIEGGRWHFSHPWAQLKAGHSPAFILAFYMLKVKKKTTLLADPSSHPDGDRAATVGDLSQGRRSLLTFTLL
jgi:hypothetical protein